MSDPTPTPVSNTPPPASDLAAFDEIGVRPATTPPPVASAAPTPAVAPAAVPGQPVVPAKPVPKRSPISLKAFSIGCLAFTGVLFFLLIIAMIFGLRAGEDTIRGMGFSPMQFKTWTIGLVSFFFGAVALVWVILLLLRLARRLLADSNDTFAKHRAAVGALIFTLLFFSTLGVWAGVYWYLNQFQVSPDELQIGIVTSPLSTTSLTSPIQVGFSAERVTKFYIGSYDILAYEWDRDSDGVVDATGEKVSLYFPHGGGKQYNGLFKTTLRVRMQPRGGGDAIVKEYSQPVSISKQEIYGEIAANFESGAVPLAVKFDGSKIADPQGALITNFAWDFDGDGRPDLDGPSYRNASHTFDTIGEHTIKLTVTSKDLNADGTHETKIFERKITVREPTDLLNAEALIEVDKKIGPAPLSITLDAGQSNAVNKQKIDRYEWLIGDGLEKLAGKKTKYTFTKPGTYLVTLRVTYFNGQTKSDTVEIRATDPQFAPNAVMVATPAPDQMSGVIAGPAPLALQLSAIAATDPDDNITSYEWDFDGDGQIDAEGIETSYSYRDAGRYRVRLRVTDADGNASESTGLVVVGSELPVVDFGADKLSGPAPLTVTFDASGSKLPGKNILAYEWNFNLGESGRKTTPFISERAQVSHIFETVGEYYVQLTLHASDGSTETKQTKIVATYAALTAHFRASRTSGAAPLAVSFDSAESTGDIKRYEWIFGDGEISAEAHPTHIFNKAGDFIVRLKIYDTKGNVSEDQMTVKIAPAPIAR